MDRKHMYKIRTVADLETWAKQNALSFDEDTELNLRRITLMADEVTKAQGHACELCGKLFKQRSHLLRHVRTLHGDPCDLQCQHCNQRFNRQDNLSRHLQSHKENIPQKKDMIQNHTLQQQGGNVIQTQRKRTLDELANQSTTKRRRVTTSSDIKQSCNWCGKTKSLLPGKKYCSECGHRGRECKWCHRPLPERYYGKRTDVCDSCVTRRENWKSRQQQGGGISALNDTAQTTTLEPTLGNIYDILQFFKDNEQEIGHILWDRMKDVKGMKWFMTLVIKFVKYDQNNEAIYAEPTFRSITLSCTNMSQIKAQIAETLQHIHNSCQNFERDGSGWSIDKIIRMEISTVEFKPLEGSSYLSLPSKIQKKKAVINVQNNDQKCFIWSVLAALYPVSRDDHPARVSHYCQYEAKLNTTGIQFPTPLSQIPKFEIQNNMSINVFGLEGNEVYPLHITSQRDQSIHVNLLLFSQGEQRHFCLIRNLSRLLGDRTLHKGQTFYCNYCLHGFSTDSLLKDHIPYCSPHGPQKMSFPKAEDQQWVYFKHLQKQLKVPFVIYADLESYIQPIQKCDPDPNTSFTTRFQKHEPCGFSYMVKCTSDELSKPAHVYRGPNVIDTFFDRLLEEEKNICDILSQVKPITLSPQEEHSFQSATNCHICQKELGTNRVRDHDHLNGIYRGAAHSDCNFQYQFRQGKRSQSSKFYIPIIFHNLRGYDLHLLMESAGKYKHKPLSCIPNNMEKYISFSLGNLRFIDSLQFLNTSLDTLVNNLAKEGSHMFESLKKHFPNQSQQELLLRKGVYCYSYVSAPDKFKETSLPSKNNFYNDLNETHISDPDYEYAQSIWQAFHMQTLGDFHDLYLKTDVLLLADVFENFREVCYNSYHLDPAHYYSSPNFSFDAMLRMTGVRLQLLNDIDMVNMIEKGVRGGICMIAKKFAQANNPESPDFDASLPKSWLIYYDQNNMYGHTMCAPLPEKEFDWVNENELQQLDILSVADDADTGYILEVDLDYPSSLHDDHNDYPLAPESLTITRDMLSEHSKRLTENLGISAKPSTKLVPNLQSKRNYVVHYRNLKYYISKGLILTKIHRALRFTQSCWLKPYIDFNTEKRKNAKNDFEKDLYKLLNNSIFGKTIENMRKRVNVELVNTPKRLRKVCAKPNFECFKIFNENLVAVHLRKINIVLNRPIYAGFCILDMSKVSMYQFHYDYMRSKYGDKAKLLFTDTDSLCYEVETENIYQDMLANQNLFDTSNYEKDHPLYSANNCKRLGVMKDELAGKVLEQYIGLRPKLYSLKYGDTESKKAKGVKKCVVDKHIKHAMYVDCLEQQTTFRHSMNLIRSYDHQLYSITVNKISLSPYDDKRYFTGIGSLAYGHWRILTS